MTTFKHLSDPAGALDYWYTMAQAHLERAKEYPFDSRESIDHRHAAHRCFENAQAIERAWLRRTAKR